VREILYPSAPDAKRLQWHEKSKYHCIHCVDHFHGLLCLSHLTAADAKSSEYPGQRFYALAACRFSVYPRSEFTDHECHPRDSGKIKSKGFIERRPGCHFFNHFCLSLYQCHPAVRVYHHYAIFSGGTDVDQRCPEMEGNFAGIHRFYNRHLPLLSKNI